MDDSATRLAAFLTDPVAASLVCAGLSVVPSDDDETALYVGKPKSTAGHSTPDLETRLIGCDDNATWGGICCDAPVLTIYPTCSPVVVEHLVVMLGGTSDLLSNAGSFRETFDTLHDAIDFIMRFYFRDLQLFARLTVA